MKLFASWAEERRKRRIERLEQLHQARRDGKHAMQRVRGWLSAQELISVFTDRRSFSATSCVPCVCLLGSLEQHSLFLSLGFHPGLLCKDSINRTEVRVQVHVSFRSTLSCLFPLSSFSKNQDATSSLSLSHCEIAANQFSILHEM